MSVDGCWWFYEVNDSNFSTVEEIFEEAVQGISALPEIPLLTKSVDDPEQVVKNALAVDDLGQLLTHDPFADIPFEIIEGEHVVAPDEVLELVMQPRILPTEVLLVGIGSQRFLELPGHLGNILVHPTEVEATLAAVSKTLDVNWEMYLQRARLCFDYATASGEDESRDAAETLEALPKALEKAKSEGVGLLALSSWGLP